MRGTGCSAMGAICVIGLVLTSCGATRDSSPAAGSSLSELKVSKGADTFRSAGCGNCHALAAARTEGAAGPDLDELKRTADQIERQVRRGGNGMPSFASTLSREQITAVARFVATTSQGARWNPIDAFKPSSLTLAMCVNRGDPSCYEQAFGNLAYNRGPKAALREFEKQIQENRFIEARCHPIAHTIGAAALLHFRGNVGLAFAGGTAACGSGYYHGLLEWKLAGVGSARAAATARDVCAHKSIRSSTFTYYQCVHGLGHGLMLHTRYDLPRALSLCRNLRTDFERVSCTGGVFMENQQASYGTKSSWLRENDLLYPCTIVADDEKLYCYLLVTSRILPAVNYDWDKTASWCRRADTQFVRICFQSLGRDASGTSRQQPAEIHRICALTGDGQRECIFGAARDILNNDQADPRGSALCRSAPAAHRSYCFYGLGSIVGTVFRAQSERRAACVKFGSGRDREDCISGAASVTTP